MIDEQLLEILACPEDKSPVRLAEAELVARINAAIAAGRLQNRGGVPVTEPIDGGLVRADGKWLYPIRDDIPVMLIDEAIALPPPAD
ncbi:MAG TPA: Trm112 family protein [bacterium]|nr:Trm112 family protein [bacterium]